MSSGGMQRGAVLCEPTVRELFSWEKADQDRFANRQYADIEVVQTEMKGFGLRARRNIAKCVLRHV